jgi:kynureninase
VRGGGLARHQPARPRKAHAPAVTRELIRREIIVDYRPGAGVRVSPHFYTKDEELELFVRELRAILDTRAYAAHEAAGAAF